MNELLTLGRDALGSFDKTAQVEWLVTNGIGGYASSTVSGVNTRRYHGLLIAALRPPVERTVLMAKLDATVRYGEVAAALATNEYADSTIDLQGFRYLDSFRLEGQMPVWTWVVGDALLEQRLWMAHGQNTTYLEYRLVRASAPMEIELQPLCTHRDFHSLNRGRRAATTRAVENGFEVLAFPGARPCRILLEAADYTLAPEWYWSFKYREESARGLDDIEDLFRPAIIKLRLLQGESCAIIMSAEAQTPAASVESLLHEKIRQQELLDLAAKHGCLATHASASATMLNSPPWIEQLVLAADQFIVERRDAEGTRIGNSVIAGYPWFSDWGRDTMIALPGLTLATGRAPLAASILRTFARFLSDGLLPNRLADAGEAPEYNTVDATLWYFVAVDEYLRHTQDVTLRKDLYPILKSIIFWHVRGTKFGIHVDSTDGLLSAGEVGVQLTWMDAKVGDWVVTPRIGKCVEINALWFNALMIMRALAVQERDADVERELTALTERVSRSFNERFWYDAGGYLYDVIDGPEGEPLGNAQRGDASLRPNQLLALSLRHPLLSRERARHIVDICGRELWTPVGLRSLASSDPRYVSHYQGGPRSRDGAYHQGTVWSWILGPFAIAHYRVYGNLSAARSYLAGMEAHLREAGFGQISEIFDGCHPFVARGCYAQAWGVAEILRAWNELNECDKNS